MSTVVDQQNLINSGAFNLAIGGASDQQLAQVVTVDVAGYLTALRLPIGGSSGELTIEIQAVADGKPTGTVLASQVVDESVFPNTLPTSAPFIEIIFSSPVHFDAGAAYAIVLKSEQTFAINSSAGDAYSDGEGYFIALPNAPGIWVPMSVGDQPHDLPFQTVMSFAPFNATDGDDRFLGTPMNDVMTGGDGADSLFGGDGRDRLSGDDGDDLLDGGQAKDKLWGGAGNDLLDGGDGKDRLQGGADDDVLNGGDGKDLLQGGTGNDALNGGAGNDTLIGGTGSDTFRFKDAPGVTNIDVIKDFSVAGSDAPDMIELDSGIFTSLDVGALTSGSFVSGRKPAASQADDFILYNTRTGQLFYDADGNGDGDPVAFAVIAGSPNDLGAADFVIV